MFSLFKNKSFLGIEFGSKRSLGIDFGEEIKLAQYQDGSFLTATTSELTEDFLADFSRKPVFTAVKSDEIEIKFINIDNDIEEDEIDKMLELEFSDDLVVQKEIITGVSQKYVIAMAVAKEEIETKFNLCRDLKLGLEAIETEFHANIRYLYHQRPSLTGVNIILDIGRDMTDLVITSQKELEFVRVFEFGGAKITEKLAKINEVSFKEAEKQKKVSLDQEELKIVLEELRSQIYHSIDYYQSKYKQEIDQMFLTGGSAKLKGLKEYLEKQIGISTKIVADPFFSVAKGLAIRGCD